MTKIEAQIMANIIRDGALHAKWMTPRALEEGWHWRYDYTTLTEARVIAKLVEKNILVRVGEYKVVFNPNVHQHNDAFQHNKWDGQREGKPDAKVGGVRA